MQKTLFSFLSLPLFLS
ncbi:outer membrane protein, partial [Helicobacter pylori]